MVTIKSFTDIEQSKKLAEFLPLESADMWWVALNWQETEYYVEVKQDGINQPKKAIPCWSLASLLGVMPQINEWITPYGHKNDKLSQFEPKICKIWEHSIVPSYKVTYGNKLSTDIYDNPVDACYELILKLNELNLL